MKLIVNTVYENITPEWLKWYTQRLHCFGEPALRKVAKDIDEGKSSMHRTVEGDMVATTEYGVKQEEGKEPLEFYVESNELIKFIASKSNDESLRVKKIFDAYSEGEIWMKVRIEE